MRATALLLLALGVAGCAGAPHPTWERDCAAGEGPLYLALVGNKDFYNTEEEVRKDRFETVDRAGRFFAYVGDPRAGNGTVTGPDAAFANVTRGEVGGQLAAVGLRDGKDHAVESAWRAHVPRAALDSLCRVVEGERDPPSGAGEVRHGCFDGGSQTLRAWSRAGAWERSVGCLPDQSPAEVESGGRILDAVRRARDAAHARLPSGAP